MDQNLKTDAVTATKTLCGHLAAATFSDLTQTALREARRGVVFTGAGVSTESGIPDFRSPGGIWSKMMPVHFQDYIADPQACRVSWERRFEMEDTWNSVTPNDGHRAIARLVEKGHVAHVITQNIDGLHAEAGVARERIIELHGNGTFARCLDCGTRHELDWVREEIDRNGDPPPCRDCGGLLKSATISFGQAMPVDEMRRAEQETLLADLFIVMGSSLVVYPAAGFPLAAKRQGARLVILNRDETPQDEIADLALRAEIGPTMRAVIDAL